MRNVISHPMTATTKNTGMHPHSSGSLEEKETVAMAPARIGPNALAKLPTIS
jgi:hypothetical protein